MNLLLINSVLGFGSTGRIVLDIAKEYEQNGYQVKIAYGRSSKVSKETEADIQKYGVRIGNDMDVYSHVLYTRLTDKHGLASKAATKRFLKWAEDYNPDILWLHNIHGYYINYELLFSWIKSRPQMQVKWTLHDCWAFTGHCSHFTYVKCDKWKEDCHNCPQLDQYPKSFRDNSTRNYLRKRSAFTNVPNLTLVTPSNWLKEIVQQSFMSEYPADVKYNTIDTTVFMPMKSTFKQDHNIQDKKIILGVASIWNERKGLNDFIQLSQKLNPNEYQVVLVGLNEEQLKDLKKRNINIIGLKRTNNLHELVKIYSSADIFVNPTYEDTFPTVNMEAEACGTKVITYNIGGCKETLHRKNSVCITPGVDNIVAAIDVSCKHG